MQISNVNLNGENVLAINLKLNQVLFAFKFEVSDFGCFDVYFMCKHSNYKHQLEYNFYSLIDL